MNINLFRVEEGVYGDKYKDHIFEQYKIYVEMADRISSRRMLANSFFLGIHTALVTAFTVLLKEKILTPNLVGLTPFIAVLILCFVWWRIVISYKQLNSGKFKVIHEYEKILPSSPYDAEWISLDEGKNKKIYLPLTHIENWVPFCFALLYLLLVINLYIS